MISSPHARPRLCAIGWLIVSIMPAESFLLRVPSLMPLDAVAGRASTLDVLQSGRTMKMVRACALMHSQEGICARLRTTPATSSLAERMLLALKQCIRAALAVAIVSLLTIFPIPRAGNCSQCTSSAAPALMHRAEHVRVRTDCPTESNSPACARDTEPCSFAHLKVSAALAHGVGLDGAAALPQPEGGAERWNGVAMEAWNLVRDEYVNQGLLDSGLEVDSDTASWLRPTPKPFKITLRFFRWYADIFPFGKPASLDVISEASVRGSDQGQLVDGVRGATRLPKDPISGRDRDESKPAREPRRHSGAEVGEGGGGAGQGQTGLARGIGWDEVGRRLHRRQLLDQDQCHTAITEMMALLPDKYSLFYRPSGLENFVQGIDPVSTPRGGSVGVAGRLGWRAQVKWQDGPDLLPQTRIEFAPAYWVQRVVAGSSAAAEGIGEGDVILGVLGPAERMTHAQHAGNAVQHMGGRLGEVAGDREGGGSRREALRRSGEGGRVGVGWNGGSLEEALYGDVGDHVCLRILSVSAQAQAHGARLTTAGFVGSGSALGFGGDYVGGSLCEVLSQRVLCRVDSQAPASSGASAAANVACGGGHGGMGRSLGWRARELVGAPMRVGLSVWEQQACAGCDEGARRLAVSSGAVSPRMAADGERVVKLRMSRVRADEAAWAKVRPSSQGGKGVGSMCVRACMCVYMHVLKAKAFGTCVCVCVCVILYIYIYIYVCVCVCVCV